MKFLARFIFIITVLMLPVSCFCEENNTKNIDRENYQIQIKQYDENYPVILYVVFKESTPLIDEIKKILRTELLSLAKTELEPKLKDTSSKSKNKNENSKETKTGLETIKKVAVASAWFDDQVSDELEKIELAKKYSAFVWFYDEQNKAKKILTFDEYLKYLKKKKEDFKKKDKLEKIEETK